MFIVTGYVTDEDLAALYSAGAIGFYPTRLFYEGFGLPYFWKQCNASIPVITSSPSSLPGSR